MAVVCSPVTPFNWVVSERRGTQQNQQQNYLRESRRAEGTQFAANVGERPNPQRQPSGHLNLQKTLHKLSVWPVAAVIDCIRVLIGSNLQRSPFGDGDGQS